MTSAADVLNYLRILGHYEPEAYDLGDSIVAKSAQMPVPLVLQKSTSWPETQAIIKRAIGQ